MPYPTDVRIPDNWQIVPTDRTRVGGEVVTDWSVQVDGHPMNSYVYADADTATLYAQGRAELDAIDAVIESVIGQTRHYGIRVWPEPVEGRALPTWRITDPHTGRDAFAFAWYVTTPPPVEVYTREQYEQACAALDLDPIPDADLGGYGDSYAELTLPSNTPREIITLTLRRRRLAGIARERAAIQAQRRDDLTAAGLDHGPYSRDQYEQACQIMQVPALPDAGCLAVVDQHLVRLSGAGALDVSVPDDDELVRELCQRRVDAMEKQARDAGRFCAECGTVIIGSGMAASFGLACRPECYDAMADRPGRYASQQR